MPTSDEQAAYGGYAETLLSTGMSLAGAAREISSLVGSTVTERELKGWMDRARKENDPQLSGPKRHESDDDEANEAAQERAAAGAADLPRVAEIMGSRRFEDVFTEEEWQKGISPSEVLRGVLEFLYEGLGKALIKMSLSQTKRHLKPGWTYIVKEEASQVNETRLARGWRSSNLHPKRERDKGAKKKSLLKLSLTWRSTLSILNEKGETVEVLEHSRPRYKQPHRCKRYGENAGTLLHINTEVAEIDGCNPNALATAVAACWVTYGGDGLTLTAAAKKLGRTKQIISWQAGRQETAVKKATGAKAIPAALGKTPDKRKGKTLGPRKKKPQT